MMGGLPSASDYTWQTVAEISLSCGPGDQDLAAEGAAAVAESVRALNLPPLRLERLKMAVVEATLDVVERGLRRLPALPLTIRVLVAREVFPAGGADGRVGERGPLAGASAPPIEAAASPSARGWGFFLVEKKADALIGSAFPDRHTIELFLYPEGEARG